MMLPTSQFSDRQERTENRQIDIQEDVAHIKGKVDMLNDWHNVVNQELAVLKNDSKWVLRMVVFIGALSVADKVPGDIFAKAVPTILKLFGG